MTFGPTERSREARGADTPLPGRRAQLYQVAGKIELMNCSSLASVGPHHAVSDIPARRTDTKQPKVFEGFPAFTRTNCATRPRARPSRPGADVKVVQQMLGHKSATMTLDLYGHLFGDRLEIVADAMDSAQGLALSDVYPLCTTASL